MPTTWCSPTQTATNSVSSMPPRRADRRLAHAPQVRGDPGALFGRDVGVVGGGVTEPLPGR